jgi:signal peptide peptidase SppA
MWLMERNAMRNFAALAASNVTADLEQVREMRPKESRQKAIGIVPITGVLEARETMLGQMLGMSSYERIGAMFDYLVKDDTVSGIVLDVASPGGMVYGAQELADKIFQARGTKPIVAVANPLMASGAYWIAAAADRIVVTPSGDVGSVGVIAEHVDLSQANDKVGAKVTIIRSSGSPYKGEASDTEPLTDEGRHNLQSRADAIYGKFVGDLAKFRGVSVDYVNENFGKGRVVDSKTAIRAGMADRVGTLEEIAGKMAAGKVRIAAERAQDDWELPTPKTPREMLKERAAAIMASVGEIAINA